MVLALTNTPITLDIGISSVSVENEGALLKLLPVLFQSWQQKHVPLPMPPDMSFMPAISSTTAGQDRARHLFFDAAGLPAGVPGDAHTSLSHHSFAGPASESSVIPIKELGSIGSADYPSLRIGRIIAGVDGQQVLCSYHQDASGIPCQGQDHVPHLRPSSKLKISYAGQIARLYDDNQAVLGAVLRTGQETLPGT